MEHMEPNNRNHSGPSTARGGSNKNDILCHFFFQFGNCSHGDMCTHSRNPTKTYETQNYPCVFFEKGKSTVKECHFSHGERDNDKGIDYNNNRKQDQNTLQPQGYNCQQDNQGNITYQNSSLNQNYPPNNKYPQIPQENVNDRQQYMGNSNYQPDIKGNTPTNHVSCIWLIMTLVLLIVIALWKLGFRNFKRQIQKKANNKKNGSKNPLLNKQFKEYCSSTQDTSDQDPNNSNQKNVKPKSNQHNKDEETKKPEENKLSENEQKPKPKKEPSITKDVKVLVIGATGAGKSSLINLFYVWSQGWKPTDFLNGKKVIIKTEHLDGDGSAERNVKNQGESQTDIAKNYTFDLKNEQKGVKYLLNFLDTPGIGDTRGVDRDEINFDIIMDTVSKTPDLNAILLVMNGADARISPRVRYIMTKLQGMIPDVLSNNLFVLLTNVDLVPNLDINKVLDKKIEQGKIFYYNNQLFKLSPDDLRDHNVKRKLDQSFNSSIQTVSMLLDLISKCTVKPTTDFLRIKESRDKIKKKIIECTDAEAKIYKNKKELQYLAAEVANGTLTISYLQTQLNQIVTEEVVETVFTPYHNTTCLACKSCCHESCKLEEITEQGSSGFKGCWAFHGSENCNKCNHSYTSHVHLREKYIKTQRQIPKINLNIQQAIIKAQGNSAAKQQAKNVIDAEIKQLDDELEQHHYEIQSIIDEMKKVCSRFDYMKEINACITVLEEQIYAVTSDLGTNLEKDSAYKLDGLKEIQDKMRKFKDDLVKYLRGN